MAGSGQGCDVGVAELGAIVEPGSGKIKEIKGVGIKGVGDKWSNKRGR